MPRLLTDLEAIHLCRTRQPSGKDIARIVKWAEADPAAEKVAPMLVLFTQRWAMSNYDAPLPELYNAIARCAELGDEELWECMDRDFDEGRVDGAILVSLYMRDLRQRLPRLFEVLRSGVGLVMKSLVVHTAQQHSLPVPALEPVSPARLEDRRAGWPKERDQMTLDEELRRGILSDEQAHALCRKFQPTKPEIRKVLDWAIAQPDAEKLRWLFILCTDYQLGKEYVRWNDAADFLAAIDMAPVWEVLEGDWEYSRLIAAGFLVCRGSDASAVERLMRLCAENEVVRAGLVSTVRRSAERLGVVETDRFGELKNDWQRSESSEEFGRRKANWPADRDRLPRPVVVHLIHDRRPELEYSTEPTQLTRSLDRIREWLGDTQFRPGLTQGEIAEVAQKLPYVLTEELCELYRWANGTLEDWDFLVYYELFKPLQVAVEQDYQMMCDLAREYPGAWKKKWFPVFNESHSWWIQELTKEPAKHGPMIRYYSAGGEPERRYRSLTQMMLVWAECYEGGAFQVSDDGTLDEDQSRFEQIHRAVLKGRGRG
jgi:hypothetical protein